MSTEFKTIEFKVGLFLLFVIVATVSLIVYIGIKKDLFAQRVTYYVVSETGENIERGIPVRLSGFKIGNVDKVHLNDTGSIKIKLEILASYQKWFREDAKIILDQEGIIGRPYFNLIPGNPNSPLRKEGSTMTLSKVAGLRELIQEAEPVIQNLTKIVANLRTMTDSFVDKKGHVQTILANAEDITTTILHNEGMLYYLTQDPRPVNTMNALLVKTEHAMQSIDILLQNTTLRVDDLKPLQDELVRTLQEGQTFIKGLHAMQQELGPTLANIEAISADVKNATTDLVGLRRQGEYTIRLGTELLQRLKETWPFARGEASKISPAPAP